MIPSAAPYSVIWNTERQMTTQSPPCAGFVLFAIRQFLHCLCGIYPRWAAKPARLLKPRPAAQATGDKSPRHRPLLTAWRSGYADNRSLPHTPPCAGG